MRICVPCHRTLPCTCLHGEAAVSARVGTCRKCHRDAWTVDCKEADWMEIQDLFKEGTKP